MILSKLEVAIDLLCPDSQFLYGWRTSNLRSEFLDSDVYNDEVREIVWKIDRLCDEVSREFAELRKELSKGTE